MATSSILLLNHGAQSQGFGRRLGLADFATNDLLRHARASTSSDEFEYPSVQSRQLPSFEQSIVPKQRSLRPVLRQSQPKGRRNVSKNRNRLNRYRSSEEGSSNFVQEGWPEDLRKNKRVGSQGTYGAYPHRREKNIIRRYTKRFSPSDGFKWPNNFGSYNNDHNSNRRFGLDNPLGYFSSALRLLSYLVRNKLELSLVLIGALQISRCICTLEWIVNLSRKMVTAGQFGFNPLGTAVPNLVLSTKNGENNCVVNRIVRL